MLRSNLYHVVTVNDLSGARVIMTSSPVTLAEAQIIVSKLNPLTQFKQMRRVIVQVV